MLILFVSLLCTTQLSAQSDDEFDRLFEVQSTDHVSNGDLRFLTDAPDRLVHQHLNTIVIHDSSLKDGWVSLEQCHRNLDQVGRLQILFREARVRELRILDYERIERAWVEGPSVQMTGVGPGARLCLAAQTLGLRDHGDGTYVLRNGPFMRRFLDGYYPMRVFFSVVFPAETLQFFAIDPQPQAGFRLWQGPGRVGFDALFEGQLTTEVFLTRP